VLPGLALGLDGRELVRELGLLRHQVLLG
jgi:hypothetical protein